MPKKTSGSGVNLTPFALTNSGTWGLPGTNIKKNVKKRCFPVRCARKRFKRVKMGTLEDLGDLGELAYNPFLLFLGITDKEVGSAARL